MISRIKRPPCLLEESTHVKLVIKWVLESDYLEINISTEKQAERGQGHRERGPFFPQICHAPNSNIFLSILVIMAIYRCKKGKNQKSKGIFVSKEVTQELHSLSFALLPLDRSGSYNYL